MKPRQREVGTVLHHSFNDAKSHPKCAFRRLGVRFLHPVLFFCPPRCGAAGGGQHQGQLLGQQQTAGSRGAVEGGRLHLLPVRGLGAALHGHGLQAELPEPGQDPRRMLPFLRRYGEQGEGRCVPEPEWTPGRGSGVPLVPRVSMGSLKGGHRAFLGPRAPLCAFITVARQNETHLRVCVGGQHNRSGSFLYASVISYSSLGCSSHPTCPESSF